MYKIPFSLKKLLLPFLIFLPISFLISLFIVEKIVKFTQPQLTFTQARNVSLRVSDKSDFLPSDLKANATTTHIGNTFEFTYSVLINSLGYRMEEFSPQKSPGEFRILMLGDSMTFGYGVEVKDNLPSRLKENLNSLLLEREVVDKKIQIVNAGFADGKSPDSYYLYLKKIGLSLNPDLIIVNYFLNNDVADLDENQWDIVDPGGLPEKISSKTSYIDNDYTRLKRPYQDWKYVIPVLRDSHLWILFATALESKFPKAVDKIRILLGVGEKLPIVTRDENYSCLFMDECTQRMNELFGSFFRLIEATYSLAQNANIPLIIGLLPANPQISQIIDVSQPEKANKATLICRLNELPTCQPQKKIREFLDNKAILYIDPLPHMVDAKWQSYYFPKDGHPTVMGNAKFSQIYFDFLTNQWSILEKFKTTKKL